MTDPTQAPSLVSYVPGLGRRPVLVTGASGVLGRAVVAELAASHTPVRAISRHPDAQQQADGWLAADLAAGTGLEQALADVAAVIHCATDPSDAQRVDVDGTRNLISALEQHNPAARLVYVSIVGVFDNPFPYYRAKADAERLVYDARVPHVVARGTQFHSFVHDLLRPRGGVTVGVSGLRFAPVDQAWFAARLVDLALAEDPPELSQYAGPETFTFQELAALTAHVEGRRTPFRLPAPAIGATLRAFRDGSNLPGPTALRGGATYAEWLATRSGGTKQAR
ncbi:uncharacterized protein YbjT (DUF2867 family) [Branchiibius hedensis]|uniref:Uncharacterized conserved protein YbjT, contains NAD(P)-binding and DUF2867 domains n=1 Tax=Branchiibius hedensis TaxID=672460 RepID=A0A2Y8ZY65_9MICO|nr:NAD(P)H-binding protein [Branchiibius hedensis]PWJ26025.1 uncharacterized protein YbjT (DUF2867 family) [Branchiibius hedensis]SSA34837.1 Uncharacterized conserved protein YbjT, contains NAD(P)-binding and DUF2867 domains [Branchiibius hedensis]